MNLLGARTRCAIILSGALIGAVGCFSNTVTIYWSKPEAGPAELKRDKEICEGLQRAAGLNEERIEKCLEAKGWSQVKRETNTEPEEESKQSE